MRIHPSYIVFVAFFGCIISALSCKRNSNATGENMIYYYPEKNIYYDSLQSNFYYSLDGARSWDSMTLKVIANGSVLGTPIAMARTGDNVWVNNESDRKEYNGVLLNIINDQTVLLAKADSIKNIKRVVKAKAPAEVIQKEEKPKKGLKKLFNNLFGKKKKPAKEKKP